MTQSTHREKRGNELVILCERERAGEVTEQEGDKDEARR